MSWSKLKLWLFAVIFAQVQVIAPAQILVKFRAQVSGATQRDLHRRLGSLVVREIPRLNVYVVRGSLRSYQLEPSVEYSEPDYQMRAVLAVNDPYYVQTYQWNLDKIQTASAWDITKGRSDVAIAILDTGIELTHTDLAGKVIRSVNLSQLSSTDVDLFGHGVHVAGIAAAATNNNIGVAGVGFDSSLMNVKVLGDTGSGSLSAVAEGMIWAIDQGAKVINMSLGCSFCDTQTMRDAVAYAWDHGAIIVSAAGNDSASEPFYPAAYPNVIAVAATQFSDLISPYSNYGGWVDIAAPGGPIMSTYLNNTYANMGGTSMAAPHVAGVAALLFAHVTDISGNGLLNDEVRNCLENYADDVGVGGIGHGRVNAYRAVSCGVIQPPIPPQPPPPFDVIPPVVTITNPSSGTVAAGTNLTIQALASDNIGISRIDFIVNGSVKCSDPTFPYFCGYHVPGAKNKTYSLQAQAFDAAGNSGVSTPVTILTR